jgi:trk system potassium uptake protein TrkH
MPDIPTTGMNSEIISGQFLPISILFLIIIGGLGWPVLVDMYQKKKVNRLSLNTKLVLTTSLFLWIIGACIFIFAEHSNTLTNLSLFDKLWYSLFHSVSGRTAGFTTIDFQSVQDFTKLTYSALMFIGGGSASMAGGIKINAFAVIIVAVLSSLKGRLHPEAFGREVTEQQVSVALTLGFLGIAFIIIIMTILNVTEPHVNFLDLLFETISAFSTSGMSVGVVGTLSNIGNIILISAMLIGRLGPIALALILVPRDNTAYNFLEERVTIG